MMVGWATTVIGSIRRLWRACHSIDVSSLSVHSSVPTHPSYLHASFVILGPRVYSLSLSLYIYIFVLN